MAGMTQIRTNNREKRLQVGCLKDSDWISEHCEPPAEVPLRHVDVASRSKTRILQELIIKDADAICARERGSIMVEELLKVR